MQLLTSSGGRSLALGLALALYLAGWTVVAYRAGTRGSGELDLERRGRQALTAASMLDACAALVLVPALALGARRREGIAVVAAALMATSAGALILDARSTRIDPIDVAGSRAVLAAIAAAAAGLARLARRLTRDVHDAAAAVYLVLLAASGGVVFAAPLLARITGAGLIAGLLLANPLVGMASATGFDLMRTDLLYQITPIGQRFFDYPSWQAAATVYTGVAALCTAASMLFRSREVQCI